jgi:hypothetical protein
MGSLRLALILMMSWLGAWPVAQAPAASHSRGQIARWVRDLDDEQFKVRQSAHGYLLRAGKPAIPALVAAATSPSLEVSTRVFRILTRLSAFADQSTAEEVQNALVKLAASAHPRAAWMARSALRAHVSQIIGRLEKGGARVNIENDKIVGVDLNSAPKLAPLLPLVRYLPDLEYLSASTRQMDDAALAQLRGLPKLRFLNLCGSAVGDKGLKYLKTFPCLREVPMGHTKVTDAGLKHLAELTQLEYLGLRGNRVTDAGLVYLRKLTNLTGLYLGETQVTDPGLKHLQGMTKMDRLRLGHLAITDVGLEHLKGMTNLRWLDLTRTKVTPAGIGRLRKALPKLEVAAKEDEPKPASP